MADHPDDGLPSDRHHAAPGLVVRLVGRRGFSTTHVATGAIPGAGVGARQRVRRSVAGRMVVAWVITLPAAALVAAAMHGLAEGIGGNAGIVAVATLAIVGGAGAWLLFGRNPVSAGNVNDVPPAGSSRRG
jgi:inorganic phosphate transporter, PiT family